MKFKGTFLAVLVAAVASPFATAGIWRCESCTPQQMKTRAEQQGAGLQTIFSVNGASILSFDVERDAELRRMYATPTMVPDAHIQGFDWLLRLTNGSRGAPKLIDTVDVRDLNLPDADKVSAFNFVRDFGMQGRTAVAVYQHGVNVTAAAAGAGASFLSQADGTIELTVKYPDGTLHRMRIRPNATIAVREGSAFDAAGNPIPEAANAGAQGTYVFERARDARNFYNHMRALGATVDLIGSHNNNYSCTWDGRTLACYRGR